MIDTFTISAFGHPFFCKQIKITDSALVEVYQVWSDSIGLLEENSIGQYDMILRGCVVNGVLYGDTNTYTGVEEEIIKTDKFVLMQNYPNPFNPSTNITYNLPVSTDVQLKVYNLLGEEVTTLVNEYRTAGKYTDVFNGTGLPSGVYIYRLKAGDYSSTKKMIILR